MENEQQPASNPVQENRIKILVLDPQLLVEMFVQGRKIAYEIIENGLPEDPICLTGFDEAGLDPNGRLNLTVASKEWPVYSQEPKDGKILPPEYLPAPMAKKIDLNANAQNADTKTK